MSLIACEDCWICCEPCAAKCKCDGRTERVRATGPDWMCNRGFPEDVPSAAADMEFEISRQELELAEAKSANVELLRERNEARRLVTQIIGDGPWDDLGGPESIDEAKELANEAACRWYREAEAEKGGN